MDIRGLLNKPKQLRMHGKIYGNFRICDRFYEYIQLDAMLSTKGKQIDDVIQLNVPDSILTERITGRWIHKASGRSYHTKFNPPKVAGIDDVTGEPLYQRKDDTAEVLPKRLSNYHAQTTPIIEHYKQYGKVKIVEANAKMSTVWQRIKASLSLD